MPRETQRYRSSLTTILTMIGVAVGLGNVWRFPYMMGSYGGSAFLFVYLAFTIFFAVPALMAELSLGRESRGSTVPAFMHAFGGTWGKRIGMLLMISVFIAGTYYAVVVSNVIFTAGFSLVRGFEEDTIPAYDHLLSRGWMQFGFTCLLISAACFVVYKGLRKGVELVSKFFVPIFLLTIIYLIIYVLGLPGAVEKLKVFLKPDPMQLNARNVFAALGQSFYSVGLGGTFMVAYGSYLKEQESIPRIAFMTGLGDVGASLLVSLFLVPGILVYGLDMSVGPGLIFDTLPRLFSEMTQGRFVGTLFLLVLSMVAFLSLVAAYEVVAGSVRTFTNMRRSRIILLLAAVQIPLALPSNLYPELIGILDLVFGSGMQVLGSVLAVIGITWGMGRLVAFRQLFGQKSLGKGHAIVFQWLKLAIPLMLIAVLIGYVLSIV